MGQYFEVILFILLVVTGVISLVDILFFAKKRKALAMQAADFAGLNKKQKQERLRAPLIADYARSLFPVFLIVFALRSFVVEPFRVPSGSMLPTIQLNDLLLVNKFAYGIRMPLTHHIIIPIGTPQRGDIVVFPNPPDPSVELIKTVIGVPGDHISMINKHLYINGKPLPQTFLGNFNEPANANLGATLVNEFSETIGNHVHQIYQSPAVPALDFQDLVVPAGAYFVMGDNRDDSDDSRYWGFVSNTAITGKAFMIWLSWDSDTDSVRWRRIGKLLP